MFVTLFVGTLRKLRIATIWIFRGSLERAARVEPATSGLVIFFGALSILLSPRPSPLTPLHLNRDLHHLPRELVVALPVVLGHRPLTAAL